MFRQSETDLAPQLIVGGRDCVDVRASPCAVRSATGELAALDCCRGVGFVWHGGFLCPDCGNGSGPDAMGAGRPVRQRVARWEALTPYHDRAARRSWCWIAPGALDTSCAIPAARLW